MFVALLAAASPALAQPSPQPTIGLCLVSRSADGQQARYRVTIDWGGMSGGGFERLDIGATDASGATWPQLRNNRLRPGRETTTEYITVSEASRYPLIFFVMGFRGGAAGRLDEQCREGFCSVQLPADGIVELGNKANVPGSAQFVLCPPKTAKASNVLMG
jgi:hypothetical protein